MSQIEFHGPAGSTLKAWKVRVGSWVSKGQIVAIINVPATGDETKPALDRVRAGQGGKITKFCAKSGDALKEGLIMAQLSLDCPHATLMKDMCADCGADLRLLKESDAAESRSEAGVSMVHSIPELKVSNQEAESLGQEDEERLLKHRKLVLLVDLDQTLIHTTHDVIPKNLKDVYHFQLYGTRSPMYHTRIRPRTQKFLETISQLYELHICTFGARLYAHTIAGFLDPKSKFFSHRILSRDECFDNRSKTANMSSLFPCGDHMVCIIDDREDVWNYSSNLVHVKPYVFFKNTGDINAPPGLPQELAIAEKKPVSKEKKDKTETPPAEPNADGTEKKADSVEDSSKESSSSSSASSDPPVESDTTVGNKAKSEEDPLIEMADDDDYLIYLEDILTTIHKAYYDMYDQRTSSNLSKGSKTSSKSNPDGKLNLKFVIPYVKRKVLQGVNLVFSGVIPTHIQLQKSQAYQIAKSLGANVLENVSSDSNLTHLIAGRFGTAKVNDVRRMKGVHIVSPDWLWCCAERWEKVDERLFLLTKSCQVTLKPPAHCSGYALGKGEPVETNSSLLPETNNPMLAFSKNDLKGMDDEVNDELTDDDSSDEEDSKVGVKAPDSEDDDSMNCDVPKGWTSRKRKLENPEESASDNSTDDDEDKGDEDDLQDMADELEKEFLGEEED